MRVPHRGADILSTANDGALRRFLRWARTSRVARRVIAARYVPISRAR